MHKDEMWQVFAKNGERIEGEGWESSLGNPEQTGSDKIVGVAVIFFFRVNEGVLELLWQRRSEKIDRYPGDFDISAGGHINLDESLINAAIRESHEEIGAKIAESDLNLVTERGFRDTRFAWIYAVDWTGKPDEFHFDDEEVSEVRWVPFSESKEFREKYAKAPLKKDELTFALLKEWFIQNGYL